MSNFWQRNLAAPAGSPPPGPQRHSPASSRPWWDTGNLQEAEPTQWQPDGSQVLYDAAGNAVLVGPNGQVLQAHELDADNVALHTKSARLAKSTETCPSCGSGDYSTIGKVFTQRGEVEAKRCFDCGYPVEQHFSGMKGTTSGDPDGKARQVEHGGVTNQFSVTTQAPAFAAENGGPSR